MIGDDDGESPGLIIPITLRKYILNELRERPDAYHQALNRAFGILRKALCPIVRLDPINIDESISHSYELYLPHVWALIQICDAKPASYEQTPILLSLILDASQYLLSKKEIDYANTLLQNAKVTCSVDVDNHESISARLDALLSRVVEVANSEGAEITANLCLEQPWPRPARGLPPPNPLPVVSHSSELTTMHPAGQHEDDDEDDSPICYIAH